MNEAYIKLSKNIVNWQWHDDPSVLSVWVYCLVLANWSDKVWHGQTIKRGSFITSYRNMSVLSGLSVNTVRRCLRLLDGDEIELKTTKSYTLINVKNYDKYNVICKPDEKSHTAVDTVVDTVVDTQPDTQPAYNKEYKDKKKILKEVVHFVPPTMDEAKDLWAERHYFSDYTRFWNYYQSNGWMVGRAKMKDWKASAAGWESRERQSASRSGNKRRPDFEDPYANQDTGETFDEIIARRIRDEL